MPVTYFAMLAGLLIGAVWAIDGFGGAVLTAAVGALGYVIALVVGGELDLTQFLGHRSEDRSSL